MNDSNISSGLILTASQWGEHVQKASEPHHKSSGRYTPIYIDDDQTISVGAPKKGESCSCRKMTLREINEQTKLLLVENQPLAEGVTSTHLFHAKRLVEVECNKLDSKMNRVWRQILGFASWLGVKSASKKLFEINFAMAANRGIRDALEATRKKLEEVELKAATNKAFLGEVERMVDNLNRQMNNESYLKEVSRSLKESLPQLSRDLASPPATGGGTEMCRQFLRDRCGQISAGWTDGNLREAFGLPSDKDTENESSKYEYGFSEMEKLKKIVKKDEDQKWFKYLQGLTTQGVMTGAMPSDLPAGIKGFAFGEEEYQHYVFDKDRLEPGANSIEITVHRVPQDGPISSVGVVGLGLYDIYLPDERGQVPDNRDAEKRLATVRCEIRFTVKLEADENGSEHPVIEGLKRSFVFEPRNGSSRR